MTREKGRSRGHDKRSQREKPHGYYHRSRTSRSPIPEQRPSLTRASKKSESVQGHDSTIRETSRRPRESSHGLVKERTERLAEKAVEKPRETTKESPRDSSSSEVVVPQTSEPGTDVPSQAESDESSQPTVVHEKEKPPSSATQSTIAEEALRSTLCPPGVPPSVWRAPPRLSTNWRGELLAAAATMRQQAAATRHHATQLYMQAQITEQQAEHLEAAARE